MKRIIFTNRRWFHNYARIRMTIYLVLLVCLAVIFWLNWFNEFATLWIFPLLLLLLILLLIIDMMFKPNVLELRTNEDDLEMVLFRREATIALLPNNDSERVVVVRKGDTIQMENIRSYLSVLNRMKVGIIRDSGEAISIQLNTGWLDERKSKELNALLAHYS